ncbi:hypothetical protein DERP_008158 [Dermatophagoides pteronyssinus]|uniref:Uncharacterized protein n=1 Tax=Dermatophagoides pteronyssinus TaxID=6956 RepID=A0ABQ8JKG4_DERPT|nr:hypothetical protein DERP_008158 [Dermatophagoides pteronyssinus]
MNMTSAKTIFFFLLSSGFEWSSSSSISSDDKTNDDYRVNQIINAGQIACMECHRNQQESIDQ